MARGAVTRSSSSSGYPGRSSDRNHTSARPTCHSRLAARPRRRLASPCRSSSSGSAAHERPHRRVGAGGTLSEQSPVGGEPGREQVGEEALGVAGAHRLGNVAEQPVAQQRTVAGRVELQLGRVG